MLKYYLFRHLLLREGCLYAFMPRECIISSSVLWLSAMTEMEAQEHFDNFFEEVFTELEDTVSLLLWHVFGNYFSNKCIEQRRVID
jgi:hypothetical protein